MESIIKYAGSKWWLYGTKYLSNFFPSVIDDRITQSSND